MMCRRRPILLARLHFVPTRLLAACAILAALSVFPRLTRVASAEQTAGAPSGSPSFAVPESPAFTLLGASPASVSQPGTPRDVAIQLVNAFDEQGHVRQGFALDLRAAYFNPIPLEQYKKYWPRFLYNAQVSAGTVQTPGDAGGTDLAVGLRLTLIDQSDPMLNDAYVRSLAAAISDCKPQQPGEAEGKALACIAERSKKVREAWVDNHWNAFRLSVAWASGWRAPGSVIKDSSSNGWSTWVAGNVPIGRKGQVVGQLQYTHRPEAASSADVASNDAKFGCRGFLGNGRINAFLELAGTRRHGLPEGSDKGKSSWSGGIEYRMSEHVWVSTGLGSSFGAKGVSSKVVVLANLRFALSDESRIKRTSQ